MEKIESSKNRVLYAVAVSAREIDYSLQDNFILKFLDIFAFSGQVSLKLENFQVDLSGQL